MNKAKYQDWAWGIIPQGELGSLAFLLYQSPASTSSSFCCCQEQPLRELLSLDLKWTTWPWDLFLLLLELHCKQCPLSFLMCFYLSLRQQTPKNVVETAESLKPEISRFSSPAVRPQPHKHYLHLQFKVRRTHTHQTRLNMNGSCFIAKATSITSNALPQKSFHGKC